MAPSSSSKVSERRGVPGASFVYDVPTYSTRSVIKTKLLAQQQELQAKIPGIERFLDVVATLQAKNVSGEVHYSYFCTCLGRHIYSQTRIQESDSVCLWLGANVMLEYTREEASAVLQKNLDNAKASLEVLITDLQFLRDQVTITQVTIARVYNWDVHQRRSKQVTPTAVKDS
ncbi:hypothetical protein MKW92_028074 [Papaver armeniacum]|nr:hypothetical protein MKW92_028074 [Papaver armeniacum]